jgi:uncharacterized protein involved in exopolysaccharide biosynthesis
MFISIALPILLGAIILAYKLPPVYQSQAKILIEQPSIPEEVVATTITSYVEERIEKVTQRVLSTGNVIAVIDEFGLYPGERSIGGDQLAVEQFREDAYLENIATEIFDARRGRMDGSTFAFVVGFHTSEPYLAQSVAQRLAQVYLDENVKSRTEKSAETTRFLEEQAERISSEISEIEVRLSEFKSLYSNALPDRQYMNVQSLERTERELDQIEQDIRSLTSEKGLLEAELQGIRPHASIVSSDGTPVLSVEERLEMLQLEYMRLSATYGVEHPDVVRTRREIDAILGSGNVQSRDSVVQQLAAARLQRNELLERYSNQHPDVLSVERSIESLENRLATMPLDSGSGYSANSLPNNPLYIQQKLKIDATVAGLQAARVDRAKLVDRRTELERNIGMAPKVEKELLELNRGYESAQQEFEEIRARISDARMSESLELQNKGERFTLLEEASLPSQPIEPNRVALVFLGIVLSIGVGVGIAALADGLDTTIRSRADLDGILVTTPLIPVLYVETAADRKRAWVRRVSAAGAVAATLTLAFVWI